MPAVGSSTGSSAIPHGLAPILSDNTSAKRQTVIEKALQAIANFFAALFEWIDPIIPTKSRDFFDKRSDIQTEGLAQNICDTYVQRNFYSKAISSNPQFAAKAQKPIANILKLLKREILKLLGEDKINAVYTKVSATVTTFVKAFNSTSKSHEATMWGRELSEYEQLSKTEALHVAQLSYKEYEEAWRSGFSNFKDTFDEAASGQLNKVSATIDERTQEVSLTFQARESDESANAALIVLKRLLLKEHSFFPYAMWYDLHDIVQAFLDKHPGDSTFAELKDLRKNNTLNPSRLLKLLESNPSTYLAFAKFYVEHLQKVIAVYDLVEQRGSGASDFLIALSRCKIDGEEFYKSLYGLSHMILSEVESERRVRFEAYYGKIDLMKLFSQLPGASKIASDLGEEAIKGILQFSLYSSLNSVKASNFNAFLSTFLEGNAPVSATPSRRTNFHLSNPFRNTELVNPSLDLLDALGGEQNRKAVKGIGKALTPILTFWLINPMMREASSPALLSRSLAAARNAFWQIEGDNCTLRPYSTPSDFITKSTVSEKVITLFAQEMAENIPGRMKKTKAFAEQLFNNLVGIANSPLLPSLFMSLFDELLQEIFKDKIEGLPDRDAVDRRVAELKIAQLAWRETKVTLGTAKRKLDALQIDACKDKRQLANATGELIDEVAYQVSDQFIGCYFDFFTPDVNFKEGAKKHIAQATRKVIEKVQNSDLHRTVDQTGQIVLDHLAHYNRQGAIHNAHSALLTKEEEETFQNRFVNDLSLPILANDPNCTAFAKMQSLKRYTFDSNVAITTLKLIETKPEFSALQATLTQFGLCDLRSIFATLYSRDSSLAGAHKKALNSFCELYLHIYPLYHQSRAELQQKKLTIYFEEKVTPQIIEALFPGQELLPLEKQLISDFLGTQLGRTLSLVAPEKLLSFFQTDESVKSTPAQLSAVRSKSYLETVKGYFASIKKSFKSPETRFEPYETARHKQLIEQALYSTLRLAGESEISAKNIQSTLLPVTQASETEGEAAGVMQRLFNIATIPLRAIVRGVRDYALWRSRLASNLDKALSSQIEGIKDGTLLIDPLAQVQNALRAPLLPSTTPSRPLKATEAAAKVEIFRAQYDEQAKTYLGSGFLAFLGGTAIGFNTEKGQKELKANLTAMLQDGDFQLNTALHVLDSLFLNIGLIRNVTTSPDLLAERAAVESEIMANQARIAQSVRSAEEEMTAYSHLRTAYGRKEFLIQHSSLPADERVTDAVARVLPAASPIPVA